MQDSEDFSKFAEELNKKSEFTGPDRRRPENEASRQAIHAAGLCRRREYIGPERRLPQNKAVRAAMDARIEQFIVKGETPVINSAAREVYANSSVHISRKTGDATPTLGCPDGILID